MDQSVLTKGTEGTKIALCLAPVKTTLQRNSLSKLSEGWCHYASSLLFVC